MNPTGFNPLRPRGTGETSGTRARASTCSEFQSTPAPRDRRDIARRNASAQTAAVSIHSGPEGPERPLRPRPMHMALEFQSTPAPRDRRDRGNGCSCEATTVFQSTPAPRDRRDTRSCHTTPRQTCFNPLRPRGTGETARVRFTKRTPGQHRPDEFTVAPPRIERGHHQEPPPGIVIT